MSQHEVTTTAQIERVYHVEANSIEQARKRLRIWLTDPDTVGAGIVDLASATDVTKERLTGLSEQAPAAKPKKAAAPIEAPANPDDDSLPF